MISDRIVSEIEDIERIADRTVDFSHIGRYVKFVRDLHPIALSALKAETMRIGRLMDAGSLQRRSLRVEYLVIVAEEQRRLQGDLPWFMRPNVKREEHISQRCARVHESWTMEAFLERECGIQLKRSKCRCPVHNGDSDYSFSVRNNRGKCFVCDWSGDVIDLAQTVWGLPRPIDAVKRLERIS